MANFTTHLAVGTVVSGTAATLTLAADVISPESLVAVTLAGVLGGVLPDIDLKDSRPSRAFFSGLAIFISFCVLFSVASRYSIAEMWIAWLGTLLFVRYGVHALFHRFSYHRGIWHSLLAGAFWWFLTAIVYHRLLGFHEGVAWLAGGFLFLGYLTHLVLDEIYSVDVMDTRVKASFGTALKLWDTKHVGESAAVGVAALLAFVMTPPSAPFIDGISSPRLWAGLQQRLLPQDQKWFGVLVGPKLTAAPSAPTVRVEPTAEITTGSIRSAAPPPADASTEAPSARQ